MARRRRYGPWERLVRHVSADVRADLQLTVRIAHMLDEGHEAAAIRASLGLDEAQAAAVAGRIGDAMRRARLQPEPSSNLARALSALAPATEADG